MPGDALGVYILVFREILERMSLALFWAPYVGANVQFALLKCESHIYGYLCGFFA
jgi:hypothetical protein